MRTETFQLPAGERVTQRELAQAIAERGVRATAAVESMHTTGETDRGGGAREIEFRLRFTDKSARPVVATVTQFMNDVALTGIAAGEPISISYDRDDPRRIVIWGSPKYVVVEPGVAVPR